MCSPPPVCLVSLVYALTALATGVTWSAFWAKLMMTTTTMMTKLLMRTLWNKNNADVVGFFKQVLRQCMYDLMTHDDCLSLGIDMDGEATPG